MIRKQYMRKIYLLIPLFALFFVLSASAQYMPAAPGYLGVGKVTANSVEWTFNLSGAMADHVQLFVGDSKEPVLVKSVTGDFMSIEETGLQSGQKYTGRKVNSSYFGVNGSMSLEFPAAFTLTKSPEVTLEVLSGKNLNFKTDFSTSGGEEAWQVMNETLGKMHDWVKTADLQLGPFEPGKEYVFLLRAKNSTGSVGEWSHPVKYTITASSVGIYTVGTDTGAKKTAVLKPRVRGLNVRTLPSMAGKIISVITPGQVVEISDEKTGWMKVSVNGKEGWSYGEYLAL
jgi:hypothetical protein